MFKLKTKLKKVFFLKKSIDVSIFYTYYLH